MIVAVAVDLAVAKAVCGCVCGCDKLLRLPIAVEIAAGIVVVAAAAAGLRLWWRHLNHAISDPCLSYRPLASKGSSAHIALLNGAIRCTAVFLTRVSMEGQ